MISDIVKYPFLICSLLFSFYTPVEKYRISLFLVNAVNRIKKFFRLSDSIFPLYTGFAGQNIEHFHRFFFILIRFLRRFKVFFQRNFIFFDKTELSLDFAFQRL